MIEAVNGRALNSQRPLTAGMTIGGMTSALCRWAYRSFFVKNVLPLEQCYTLTCFFLRNGLQQLSERPGPAKGDLTHNAHCTWCGLSEPHISASGICVGQHILLLHYWGVFGMKLCRYANLACNEYGK